MYFRILFYDLASSSHGGGGSKVEANCPTYGGKNAGGLQRKIEKVFKISSLVFVMSSVCVASVFYVVEFVMVSMFV